MAQASERHLGASGDGAAQVFESGALPADVRETLSALTSAGHSAYLSGQMLRDLLTGAPAEQSPRAEILTSAKLASIRRTLQGHPWLRMFVDADGGKIPRLAVPMDGGGIRHVLLTPLRDQAPPSRWFRDQRLSGIELDLATREITIHALAADPEGQLIDPYGGAADLQARQIRTVVPANRVFREGGLWLLKVAKYVAAYGFSATRELVRAAQRDAGNILDVPRGLWKGQIDKILLSNHVMAGLDFLHESTVLQYLVPEVEAMIGFHTTCPYHHKDLWDHTKQVIHQADRNLIVRWAALMHDIGKVWTRSVTREGKVHFFRHEDMGALLFEGVAARLQFPAEETERVEYVIRQHSRVNLYDETWTDSAVRRLIRECGDRLEDLVAFSKADFTTKREHRRDAILRQLAELEQRLAEIRAQDARIPPLPKGLGTAISERFGIPPSRRIGELRDWLEAEVEAGRLESQRDVEFYMSYLQTHAEAAGITA